MKSDGYHKNRHTRVYLCAASGDESGKKALEWTLDSLVEDGDELVAVRGFEQADLRKCITMTLVTLETLMAPHLI